MPTLNRIHLLMAGFYAIAGGFVAGFIISGLEDFGGMNLRPPKDTVPLFMGTLVGFFSYLAFVYWKKKS